MDTDYSDNRLPPSSSELVALLTLSPPSPILSCSELSTSITSGDIPLLLDGLDLSILHAFPSTSTLQGRRSSVNESIYDAYLSQSDSTASIGTFGPVHKLPNSAYREPNESLAANEGAFQWHTATFLRLQTRASLSNMERRKLATSWGPWGIDNSSGFTAGTQVQSQERFTNVKRTGSQRATTAHQAVIQSFGPDLATNSARLQQLGPEVESPPSKQHTICTSVNHCSRKSTTEADSKTFTLSQACAEGMSWLSDVKVLLSIDQEGFRSINPSFRFVECITQPACDRQPRKQIVAQFVPVHRQTFHFHYAPFDGLPVLRRIYVNEDENHDYISREATLALKSNGLYAVRGVELANHSADDDNRGQHDATDLRWEFVYKLDDRRVGPSRKLIDGEKNFTPLSFSCSPALLQPSQGKKINLMHVVRKSISARLAAEKMDDCELDLKLAKAFNSARLPYHDAATVDFNLHRRALSYGLQQGMQSTSAATPFPQEKIQREKHNDAYNNDQSQSSRRRRASSAGEWKGLDCQPRHKLVGSPPIQKHIVDPARLAQMLEESNTESKVIQAPQPDFRPLAPDPHHYRSFHRNKVF